VTLSMLVPHPGSSDAEQQGARELLAALQHLTQATNASETPERSIGSSRHSVSLGHGQDQQADAGGSQLLLPHYYYY
jgi:hypothetical protein